MLLTKVSTVELQACIDACLYCAQACNKCFKQLLEEQDINIKKEAAALLVDCAEICYVTAAYLSKDVGFSTELASSCAELCEKCAAACEQYTEMHCKASVDACRSCASECRSLL